MLYAITTVFNPVQYISRYILYQEFAKRCVDIGIILFTVEAVFEGQEYKVTKPDTYGHIQVKASSMLWHKESLINIGIKSLPPEAIYIAWIDADILFTNPNIADDTMALLNRHDIVQMFGSAIDLDPVHEISIIEKPKLSFFKDVIDQGWPHTNELLLNGHPGYAWATRKDCIEKIGGLLDFCILGTADTHMAHSFIGINSDFYNPYFNKSYKEKLLGFHSICKENKFSIGYVPGTAIHYYHGKKENRLYDIRDDILVKQDFDPYIDIIKDDNGLYVFSGNKPILQQYVSDYFYSRLEDDGITKPLFFGI